ncbi:TetR/AcrR family transcriptional regulator [Leifsonia shinshuensis]|uniref:TetR/AcrR family transcriptional regulator n=1 Tax=Leifsonia shinshuensis TaxID=150026 RepID=UPI001F50B94D|nr:TetR/AcrR family transcriptional regulator [Leifsonia shinshuensis]MCI0158819.1 TetR/AcrR family transcriptional regulator [Leifsonia shinshuensis]
MSTARAPRSDAARNRAKLLTAATELFHESTGALSVEEVAQRAGVGVGTFYRNFPTKRALLEALMVQEIDALSAVAEQGDDSGNGLADFITATFRGSRFKVELTAALEGEDSGFGEDVMAASARLRAHAGRLLADAQRSGEVRADLQLDDVLALLRAAYSTTRSTESGERIARVIVDGLRARPVDGRRD